MLALYKRWRRNRYLRDHLVAAADFLLVLRRIPACHDLDNIAQDRLRRLATLFLREKVFHAVGDTEVDPQDQLLIAVNACLPILNLGIDAYDSWVTVVVYPDEFLVDYEEEDEAGVVHSGRDLRAGEAWDRGPLVISLRDMHAQSEWEGYNVVIHECAHQLDMRNGGSDGLPPLHRGMSVNDWNEAFTHAYEDMHARISRDEETPLDGYAAESPAECFAVFSEYFFEAPSRLLTVYPAVYDQLAQFYRQDPAAGAEQRGVRS
ncbi:MAG: zinc-dependent peptidase [Halobacteria archaeon]|nr:zinc-dependent peptidase [Halobacteria archaeon]